MIGVARYLGSPPEKQIDSMELIHSAAFARLHQSALALDSIKNIAVLPNQHYLVVNGLVIHLAQHTYGPEPELGFYQAYYEAGDQTRFHSLDKLFAAHRIPLDSVQVCTLRSGMVATGVQDITLQKEAISYRWKVSAMYGEEGIVYSPHLLQKDSTRFDGVESLGQGFYHFTVYQ